jgi:hypothetical protein
MDGINLFKRDDEYCYYQWGNKYCRSAWWYWGRWVLAGIAVLVLVLVLLSCACLARRRRKRGIQPYYGTAWMAPSTGKYGGNGGGYNGTNNAAGGYSMNNYGQQQQEGYVHNPPPAYGQQQPQYTGTTFNPADGYYGAAGPQSPPNSYQREGVYPPPPAPPAPGKH